MNGGQDVIISIARMNGGQNVIISIARMNSGKDGTKKQLRNTNATLEEEEPADFKSAKEIKKMPNGIADFIQWEKAAPSNSPGGRLPILDVQCWHSNTSGNNTTIYYIFYR